MHCLRTHRAPLGPCASHWGGFQEKLCIVSRNLDVHDGRTNSFDFLLPDAVTVSTHILKPQPVGPYPLLIESEAWAMTVASYAARCASVALLEIEGAPQTLVVQKFDRLPTNDRAQRIHQEDCCQALGLSPHQKYASESTPKGSDPTYKSIARLLMRYAPHPLDELHELLRQLIVNLVMGNTDAHAKNYSLLYQEPCSPTLSPIYDAVPIQGIEKGQPFFP